MLFVVSCPECLHIVGCQPPVEQDEKAQCSHCDALIDAHKGYWINEPAEPVKEFDLLSVE